MDNVKMFSESENHTDTHKNCTIADLNSKNKLFSNDELFLI
jgi:hypothetical protein